MMVPFLVVISGIVLGLVVAWFAIVAQQVERIRAGYLDVDDDEVIGAARWWVTGRLRP